MTNCFVIMPFRPELSFFYRSVKKHIEDAFPNVTVARGDDQILTTPILNKIMDFIRQADFVIADITGRNPNVFYELGMAHALEKPVVLITSDAVEEAPTDVRSFEFVSYSKLDPDKFLEALDKALRSQLGSPFASLYPEALSRFKEFRDAKNRAALEPATETEFSTALSTLRGRGWQLPRGDRRRAESLVRRMLGAEPEIELLNDLKDWLDESFPN